MIASLYPLARPLLQGLDPASAHIEEVHIPRPVRFLKVPAGEPKQLAEVVAELELLQIEEQEKDRERQPFLEVCVLVDGPEPHLQSRILAALEGKSVRLTRIVRERSNEVRAGVLAVREQELADLKPESVFAELHRAEHATEPTEALGKAFQELLLSAHDVSEDS